MTDEKKITIEGSMSYDEFCERLSSPASADLMYTHDVLGRVGLEVLWLKLSLLAEIIGVSRTTRINLSQCQIKLISTTTKLPRFWNFSVECLPAAADPSLQAVLHKLGLYWFRTLLANLGQTAADMETAVESLLAASAGNPKLLIDSALHSQTLQSTQLLVAKEQSHTNAIPADLWQRTLQIGLRLATQVPNFSYSSQADDVLNAVLGRVLADTEALRARVATALFIEPPRMEQDLGELLNELIRDPRWLDSFGAVSASSAAVTAPVTRPAPAPVAQVVQPEAEHDMESTIIIKRGSSAPSAPAAFKPAPAASPARVVPPPPAPAAEENLEATIIISKDKKR